MRAAFSYHLYIKPEYKYDQAWMFHLFSPKLWRAFILLLFLLGIASYINQKYSINDDKENKLYGLQDHMIYTVAIAAGQGPY